MKTNPESKKSTTVAATLRLKAEELLKERQIIAGLQLSESETQKLIYELGMHQIELELQIEELALAEEKAQVAYKKYAELYDFAPSGYFTLSPESKIIELNHSGANMLGKERSKLKNSLFGFFVSNDTKIIFNHFLGKLFTSKAKESCEVTLSTNGNSPIYVQLNGVGAQNREQCFITMIDITDRKQAKEKQQKITERLSLACRAGGIGIWELDVINNNLIWDDQMFKLYGIMPDQFTGTYETWRAGVLPADLPKSEEELQMALSGSNDFNTEFRVAWPDGSIHSIHALADVQKDSSGNAVGLIGTNYDITEIKQMESEIRHKNEELQKLNAEKDKFFSIIAHDLKSPFNSFLGLTQIMAEELPNLTMVQVQEIAVSMSKTATNLYRLLENLLQWSRMQQGSIPFNPELLQLLQVVEECIETITEPAKNKGIEITNEIPDDLEVFADSNILQTVIRNIVSNAEKFTPKGGKIIVSARVFNDNSVEISVKDNGIGMSQSMVGNLFRLDVQTNRKGTEGEPSSGLGLFLCYEFIKKHGGKIWVESEVGKGSEFKITLPIGN